MKRAWATYTLEDAESIPLRGDELLLVCVHELGERVVDRSTSEGTADNDQRPLRSLELLGELALARDKVRNSLHVVAEVVVTVRRVDTLADQAHLERGVQSALPDA